MVDKTELITEPAPRRRAASRPAGPPAATIETGAEKPAKKAAKKVTKKAAPEKSAPDKTVRPWEIHLPPTARRWPPLRLDGRSVTSAHPTLVNTGKPVLDP